jgi:4-diphosphocytidyl-2-C-methyl-D-erythritol kinase
MPMADAPLGVTTERAYAKINLFLEVLGKRADGYHELETIMHEVDLWDDVELTPGGEGLRLEVSDPTIGSGEDNLAVKAVRACEARLGRPLPCRIVLTKRIPAGGGLGGGSSDAAAVLRALNRAFDLRLDALTLAEIAATFGSDTAFFVRGGTASCTGRGELIAALGAPPLDLVLVLPGIHCPTPLVFKTLRLTDCKTTSYDLRRCLEKGDIAGLRRSLFNRLEEPARREFPALDRLLRELSPHGARLSGSGSTIFVLCDDKAHAERVKSELDERYDHPTIVTSSASR